MRCEEIKERFVDLLYDEPGMPPADPELQAHLRSCIRCQAELAGLKEARATLKVWQDEPLLRPVVVPRSTPARHRRPLWSPAWNVVRYAAIAVLVVLAFLGVSNASIQWDRNGLSFRTSLLSRAAPAPAPPSDTYSKKEIQEIVARVMDSSQQLNYQMILRAIDTLDQERAMDLRFIRSRLNESRNKN